MKNFKELREKVKKPTGGLKDACWTGYTAVGMKMKGGRKVPNCVPEEVTEAKDHEYSDPHMAVNQLRTIMHNAEELCEMLGGNTDLPEWVESKITLAEDYIMTVANYMRSELKEEVVAEGSGKNVVKSVKVGNFRHDLVNTGMGWQVRIHNGDKLYDTGLSKNSEEKGLAALDNSVAYTKKQLNIKEQGVAEGAPELLKKEMPTHRHAEKLLAQNGVSKDDPDYYHHLNNTIKHLRQFGNIDLINKGDEQGVAEEVESMFDIVEELVMEIAETHNIDPEVIWEDLEDVSDEELYESAAWRRKEGKDPKGGLNRKGVASYRRENPGSKLKMAVTTKPSKLKPGSKAANRRKSFCARMGGMKGPMKKDGKPTRKALALRKWNC